MFASLLAFFNKYKDWDVTPSSKECLHDYFVDVLVAGGGYSAFQNYRRVGFLKYFKFGWNFLRIVFEILLRIAPQLLSYSF